MYRNHERIYLDTEFITYSHPKINSERRALTALLIGSSALTSVSVRVFAGSMGLVVPTKLRVLCKQINVLISYIMKTKRWQNIGGNQLFLNKLNSFSSMGSIGYSPSVVMSERDWRLRIEKRNRVTLHMSLIMLLQHFPNNPTNLLPISKGRIQEESSDRSQEVESALATVMELIQDTFA